MTARRLCTSIAIAAALFAPATSHAQERQLFTWQGRVDREVRLTVHGRDLSNTSEQSIRSNARFRVNSVMPMNDGTLRIGVDRGRGSVTVVQQPSSGNNFTGIILIRDDAGGADNYRISAYYTPVNGGYDRGRGRGRDRMDGDDRNRDDRNRDDRDRDGRNRGGQYGNGGQYGGGNGGQYGGGNGGQYGGGVARMQWSGYVDNEVQIMWRDGRVTQRVVSGSALRDVRSSLGGGSLSGRNGPVSINVRDGRGRVDVIQQPSSNNGYTAIIRIVDPEGGAAHYDLEAIVR